MGMNFNELTEALYDKLLLPLAGLLVALFTGWFMHREHSESELADDARLVWRLAVVNALRCGACGCHYSDFWLGLTTMLMTVTDWLWSYILIGVLLAIGVRFTLGSRGVQLRLFKRTLAVFSSIEWQGSERGISSLASARRECGGESGWR